MLSGNLTDFALLDVVQLLLTSSRTGKLHIDAARGGDVWIENGEVVHALSLGKVGDEALSLIASLQEGRFNFDQNAVAPGRTVSVRREALLTRMFQESDAWQPIVRVLSDWTTPLRFTAGWSDQTRVTRQQYRVLSLVGRGGLGTMVTASPLAPRELLETLLPFWQAGKLEYVA